NGRFVACGCRPGRGGSPPAFGFIHRERSRSAGGRCEETTMWYSAVGSIVTLLLSLLAVPLAAVAQPPSKVYRLRLPWTGPPRALRWEALLEGWGEGGYREGQTLVFEHRFSEGKAERFRELAAELVQLQVDCIITPTTPAALAAKHATQTIPIVMTTAL